MKYALLFLVLIIAGCAGDEGVRRDARPQDADSVPEPRQAEKTEVERQAALEKRSLLPKGTLDIDITSVVGQPLPSRVDLFCFDDGTTTPLDVPKGALEASEPAGAYRAYVHVFEESVPIMVEVKDLDITANQTTYLLVNLLEGAGGMLPLTGFDSDGDLALDRVELAMGTDPYNAGSIPGRVERFYDTTVITPQAQWYSGELQAYSNYGVGTEDVTSIVRRAEKAGLNFLAITDRNTLAAADDPAYKSSQLVCLPAMEWGTDAMGVALVYGPRTTPDPPGSIPAAQAECIRVQAQGGAWIAAHPAFPTKPWQWGLSFINGVQVWFRNWRDAPPMALQHLGEIAKERRDGQLVHSIAAAAAAVNHGDMSSNGQSNLFYDYELVRGLMAGIIGGSASGSSKVPLGRPLTYIHARELSVPGLLEGLRLGRTYVSSGPDGPKIFFGADVLSNGKVDVGIGGVIPLNAEVSFEVVVRDAIGKKLQVIENGRPIRTVPINAKDTGIRFKRVPVQEAAYRVRIISPADARSSGFGPLEIHAITSPIYARDVTTELLRQNTDWDNPESWVGIRSAEMVDLDAPMSQPPDMAPSQMRQW